MRVSSLERSAYQVHYHPHKNDYKMNYLGICFRLRFRNGKANQFPQIFFRICFRNDHVGQAQATTAGHTYEKKSNFKREKILNPGILFIFACNCFCEDGSFRSTSAIS